MELPMQWCHVDGHCIPPGCFGVWVPPLGKGTRISPCPMLAFWIYSDLCQWFCWYKSVWSGGEGLRLRRAIGYQYHLLPSLDPPTSLPHLLCSSPFLPPSYPSPPLSHPSALTYWSQQASSNYSYANLATCHLWCQPHDNEWYVAFRNTRKWSYAAGTSIPRPDHDWAVTYLTELLQFS